MAETKHLQVRDTRDRLIDMLGIGETYPLRDVALGEEQLTVVFKTPARIRVEESQPDVLYRLCRKNGEPVPKSAGEKPECCEETGNGLEISIATPAITEDATFKILARKPWTGREAWLLQTASVKVGLDTSLEARILEAPLLDPTIGVAKNTDARLIDYGKTVEVELEKSQEGVDYRLVRIEATEQGEKEASLSDTVRGNLHDIRFLSVPIYEDTDLRIRATKVFDSSSGKKDQTDLLAIVLPLRVRANPALSISADPPVSGYGKDVSIKIAGTQKSAAYQAYFRTIADSEYVRTISGTDCFHTVSDREYLRRPVLEKEIVSTTAAGEPLVRVHRPERPEVWKDIEGFLPVGNPVQGNGGEIVLSLKEVKEDSLLIIKAQKEHQAAGKEKPGTTIASSIQLEQALAVPVRPDPGAPPKLIALAAGKGSAGQIRVSEGLPGVFYEFSKTPDVKPYEWCAYIPKKDESDVSMNKGIGRIGIEIDFVIAADHPTKPDPSTDLSKLPPEAPLLETGLEAGAVVHVTARKAQTGLAVPLDNPVKIGSEA